MQACTCTPHQPPQHQQRQHMGMYVERTRFLTKQQLLVPRAGPTLATNARVCHGGSWQHLPLTNATMKYVSPTQALSAVCKLAIPGTAGNTQPRADARRTQQHTMAKCQPSTPVSCCSTATADKQPNLCAPCLRVLKSAATHHEPTSTRPWSPRHVPVETGFHSQTASSAQGRREPHACCSQARRMSTRT